MKLWSVFIEGRRGTDHAWLQLKYVEERDAREACRICHNEYVRNRYRKMVNRRFAG